MIGILVFGGLVIWMSWAVYCASNGKGRKQ